MRRRYVKEYYVRISDINIPSEKKRFFFTRRIRMIQNHYHKTGKYRTRIIIDRDFNLVRGYVPFMAASLDEIISVPVRFTDQRKEKL